MASSQHKAIGTINKYKGMLRVKKQQAVLQAYTAQMALDMATAFWAQWQSIETRLPKGESVATQEQMLTYDVLIDSVLYESARGMARLAVPTIYHSYIAGIVSTARQLGVVGEYFNQPTTAKAKEADNPYDDWIDLPNSRATEWAETHAAEMVTQINTTTRNDINKIVSSGIGSGQSYDQISNAIRQKFVEFSIPKPQGHIANRGVLVAVTETANAYCEGNMQVGRWLESKGLPMMKIWQSVEDAKVSDGCKDNQSQGWIPLGESFRSGHDRPPRFPGCRCDVLQEMLDEEALGKEYGSEWMGRTSEIPHVSAATDKPDWSEYRADLNGYESVLNRITSGKMSATIKGKARLLNGKLQNKLSDVNPWKPHRAIAVYQNGDLNELNRQFRMLAAEHGDAIAMDMIAKDPMKYHAYSGIFDVDRYQDIGTALKNYKVTQPIQVTRYIDTSLTEGGGMDGWFEKSIKAGGYTDYGYASTSIDPDFNLKATGGRTTDRWDINSPGVQKMNILVPEGEGYGGYIGNLQEPFAYQKEFIIQRGTHYNLVYYDEATKESWWTIERGDL